MFSALLLSLALLSLGPTGTPHMSEILALDFSEGPPIASQPHFGFGSPGVEIVSSGAFGGAYAVEGGNEQATAWGRRIAEFGWGSAVFTPTGRAFHVSMCLNHNMEPTFPEDGTYIGPSAQITLGRNHPGDVDGAPGPGYVGAGYSAIWSLVHGNYDDTTGFLILYFNSYPGGVAEIARRTGGAAFTGHTAIKLTVEGEVSTVTGGDEWGGGTAAFDGWIKVLVDGTAVIDLSGLQYGLYINNQGPPEFYDTWANPTDYFHWLEAGPAGQMGNLCLRDDLSDCGLTCTAGGDSFPLWVNNTVPCCATDPTTGGGGGGGDTGVNPDPVGVLPAWSASCTNGGVVDTVADLAEGEVW